MLVTNKSPTKEKKHTSVHTSEKEKKSFYSFNRSLCVFVRACMWEIHHVTKSPPPKKKSPTYRILERKERQKDEEEKAMFIILNERHLSSVLKDQMRVIPPKRKCHDTDNNIFLIMTE